MADRNSDLVKALEVFKRALVAHLVTQSDITTANQEIAVAVDRILSKTIAALAAESFLLESHQKCIPKGSTSDSE